MNNTLKKIVIIIIMGLVGWFGIFVVLPVLFTAAIYVIGFIVIALVIVGLYTWIKEFLDDIDIDNINKSTAYNKSKTKDNISLYSREKDEEEIHTVLTYIEALPSIELDEINENDKLYLVIEKENKYGKDVIAVYSRYWYKIGYCNENLSKILTKLINKGINYIGIVVEVNKYGNNNLELKVRVTKTLYNPIENYDSEDLNSKFITTVVGVTFDNRQEIISAMKKGDKLSLVREIENKYDNNAIAIYNLKNTQIGYCNKQLSKLLAPLMDSGTIYEAEAVRIKGGGDLNFGVDIKIVKSMSLENKHIINASEVCVAKDIDIKSKEIISQLASVALEQSSLSHQNFKQVVREMLNVKLERVNGDNDLYIESLKTNVLYYLNMIKDTENLVVKWFKVKEIPSKEEYLKEFLSIQKDNKTSNFDNAKNKHLISKIDLIKSKIEKIDELEFNYIYYNGYFDIWVEYIALIVANPNMIANLFSESSNSIIEEIRHYCSVYTNLKIDNLSLKYKS